MRRLEKHYRSTGANSDGEAWRSAQKDMHQSFSSKRNELWTSNIDLLRNDTKGLWSSVSTLLEKKKIKESPIFTADDFLKFFEDKVDDIRCKTEGAVEPTYSSSPCCHFNEFSPISPHNVIKVISAAPNKQSSLNPWPTWLL